MWTSSFEAPASDAKFDVPGTASNSSLYVHALKAVASGGHTETLIPFPSSPGYFAMNV